MWPIHMNSEYMQNKIEIQKKMNKIKQQQQQQNRADKRKWFVQRKLIGELQ